MDTYQVGATSFAEPLHFSQAILGQFAHWHDVQSRVVAMEMAYQKWRRDAVSMAMRVAKGSFAVTRQHKTWQVVKAYHHS